MPGGAKRPKKRLKSNEGLLAAQSNIQTKLVLINVKISKRIINIT